MGKKSGSGSWMNKPDHISESLEIIFGVKILLMRIRDGKKSDPGWEKFGSGINIPDPQDWYSPNGRCLAMNIYKVSPFLTCSLAPPSSSFLFGGLLMATSITFS
jgi:hypothetical protein